MANRYRTVISELAREKIWSRLHILPLLQAEEDRDQARRFFADKARERELLGQETKVYNSDRYAFHSFGKVSLGRMLTSVDSSALHSSIPPPSSPSERDELTSATATATAIKTATLCLCCLCCVFCVFIALECTGVKGVLRSRGSLRCGSIHWTVAVRSGRPEKNLLYDVDIPSQSIRFSNASLSIWLFLMKNRPCSCVC